MMKLKTITLDDLGIYLPARNRLSQLQTEFPENIPSKSDRSHVVL